METSAGCCTRGVNIALVPSTGDWQAKADFILVMDTEGLCNPNFQDEPWYDHHNNWLASLAILAPDACCLVSNNEDDTVVRNVLPFAMLCHHNSQKTLADVGFNERKLLFVYNRIDPADAKKCLKYNRLTMMKTLEEKKKELKETATKDEKPKKPIVANPAQIKVNSIYIKGFGYIFKLLNWGFVCSVIKYDMYYVFILFCSFMKWTKKFVLRKIMKDKRSKKK